MYHRKRKSSLLLAVLICLMLSPIAHGDFYLEWEHVTNGPAGQHDRTKITRTYYTPSALRLDIGEETIIMDSDAMTMYQLNTRNGTYTESIINKTDLTPTGDREGVRAFQRMLSKVTDSLQITPTGQTRRIAGYTCNKYNVNLMKIDVGEAWLSEDVEGHEEFRMVANKMANMFMANPALKHVNIVAIVEQLDAFPVQMITRTGGGVSTTTLKDIKKKVFSKELFMVPEAYVLNEAGHRN